MPSMAECSGSRKRSSCSRRGTSRCPRRNARGCWRRASSTRASGRPVIVGLIGAGNMARALARGWAAAEAGPDELMLSDVDTERSREAADEVGGKAASNAEVADSADLVVLAMKPGSLGAVAEDVRVTVSDRRLPVVSILGATTITQVTQAFGPGTPVVRFMPNVAAEVRGGTFCYAR